MIFKILCVVFILLPQIFGQNRKDMVQYSVKQYTKLAKILQTGVEYPYSGDPLSQNWVTTDGVNGQWTAGFYTGVLWYLYDYTKSKKFKELAIQATDGQY